MDDSSNIINQIIEIELIETSEKIQGRVRSINKESKTITIAIGEDLFSNEIREINIDLINNSKKKGIKVKWIEKQVKQESINS